MPHTATVTGKTGPNVTNTAMVFSNVQSITIDYRTNTISIDSPPVPVGAPGSGDTIREFDLAGITSIVDTITGGLHAIVIS